MQKCVGENLCGFWEQACARNGILYKEVNCRGRAVTEYRNSVRLGYARRGPPRPASERLPGAVRYGYTSSELTGTDPNQPLAARSTAIELSQERYLRVSSDVDGDRWTA